MEEKSIIKKYESFLKLNHLSISNESAKDFTELYEESSLLALSMEYVNKGSSMASNQTKKKYFENALKVNPNNFAAKICLIELKSFSEDEYKKALAEEYSRLLAEDYMNPRYYEKGIVDFERYQETFNYLRGLRSYYILLVGNDSVEESIRIAQIILELNPKDHFHIESSLPFLYLRIHDQLSAISLIHENDQLILGTKEIILAYSAYLNMETEKALGYLDDINAVNPYFYRILVGEEDMSYSFAQEDSYSKAEYLFLNFSIVGSEESEGFDDLLEESLKRNPIENNVSKDEWLILEILALMEKPLFDVQAILREARVHMTDAAREISSYSDGRIGGALEALSIQKIVENNALTPYGNIFIRKIKERNRLKKGELRGEAFMSFCDDNPDMGRLLLLQAMDLDNKDYSLKLDYISYEENPDEKYMISLIEEMSHLYIDYQNYTKYSSIKDRQSLERDLDGVTFYYYKNAFKSGYVSLLEAYTKIDNPFFKYTNMIQMVQYLNHSILDEENPKLAFYALYKEYKEKGIISMVKLKETLKQSKLDVADHLGDSFYIPYRFIDEDFAKDYYTAIQALKKDDIFTQQELDILNIIRRGGKELRDACLTFEFHSIASKLEKAFLIVGDKDGIDYILPEFVLTLLDDEK